MNRALECPVCVKPFDTQGRRPKSLPCGHSLCLCCLQGTSGRQCPQCRQEWGRPAEELPDNFLALDFIGAQQGNAASFPEALACSFVKKEEPVGEDCEVSPLDHSQLRNLHVITVKKEDQDCELVTQMDVEENFVFPGPAVRSSLWCVDCRAPSSTLCLDQHDVRNSKGVLRQCLQDAVPRVKQLLDGLLDGVQDGSALAALHLLRGVPGDTCTLTLRKDGEDDPLLLTMIAALAASGRLLQAPRTAQHELLPATVEQVAVRPDERIQELDLRELSDSRADQRLEEKAATLARVRQQGVRRMRSLRCQKDPAWTLELLRSAASSLEELHVVYSRDEHLLAVLAIPGLRRLEVMWRDEKDVDKVEDKVDDEDADEDDDEDEDSDDKEDDKKDNKEDGQDGTGDKKLLLLPPPPRASLQWLRAEGLPGPTLECLIKANSATLEVLCMSMDHYFQARLKKLYDDGSPPRLRLRGREDLHVLLDALRRLKKLVLLTPSWRYPTPRKSCGGVMPLRRKPGWCYCKVEMPAVRGVLPGLSMQCTSCNYWMMDNEKF